MLWADRFGPKTLMWVPHALRGRFADLAAALVLRAIDEEQPPEELLRANHLLRLLPALVLRLPPPTAGDRDLTATAAAASLPLGAVVRRRLQLAEGGLWSLLVEELVAGDPAAPTIRNAGGDDEAAAELRTLQAAAAKVYEGNVRAAVNILTEPGVAPPTPEVRATVQGLLPQAEAGALEQRCAQARALLATAGPHAPRVTLRAVARRVRLLRAGAAGGASGWRNSHIQVVLNGEGGPAALAALVPVLAQGEGDRARAAGLGLGRHRAALEGGGQERHPPHRLPLMGPDIHNSGAPTINAINSD